MRSRGAASNEGRRWRGDHFGALLVILVTLLVLSGFGRRPLLRLAAVGLLVAAMVVMHRVLRGDGPRRWVVELAEVGALALAAVSAPITADWAHALSAGLTCALFGWMGLRCLARVLSYGDVELRSLFGALCVYLLIGFAFASCYRFLSAVGPRAVTAGGGEVDETYFSFVTLTTVGFGDLLPATAAARRVAVVEAMSGQIFLATVVARLVSLFRAGAPGSAADAT
ncbi:MAG: ion channel [Acidimicrobiia bacterium]